MPRYFIEVSYKGGSYSGFQVQDNANTIQAEVEKCLQIFYKVPFLLTGSSRTDAGVHALQNYFHVDYEGLMDPCNIYHLNAILPGDIVIKNICKVVDSAHCRFDAISRTYRYNLYDQKDPFLEDRAFFYPFKMDKSLLQEAAMSILAYHDFSSFSKKNTQVNNFICTLYESGWKQEGSMFIYEVTGNRFLRGMVRGLVGTMLRVGTGKLTMDQFKAIIDSKESRLTDFSVPPHGLFLQRIHYPVGYWQEFVALV